MRKRRLKRARIKFLSLVPKGANRLPTILKGDGAFEVGLLTKELTDNGELHALVYSPEFRDSQGDIASAEVIKDMAYEAARAGVEIDVRHDNKPVGRDRAFVAESFIVQKGDPRFSGMTDYSGMSINPEGSWGVVIKILDEDLRAKYKTGSWKGVSMGGVAEVEHEKEDVALSVVNALAKRLGLEDQQKENDMALTPEEIQKIAESTAAILAKASDAGTKKAEEAKKAEEIKTDSAPVFKGDPTNADDVAKHVRALRKHKIMQDVDWSDPEAVAKLHETLAKTDDDDSTETDGDDSTKQEIAKLQAKIDSLSGRSNQPTGNGGKPADTYQGGLVGVDKETQDLCKIGSAMAAYVNSLG